MREWGRLDVCLFRYCMAIILHRLQSEFRNFINRFKPQPRTCWEELINPGFCRKVGQSQDPNSRQDSNTVMCVMWTSQCGQIHLVKDSFVPLHKSVLWGDSCIYLQSYPRSSLWMIRDWLKSSFLDPPFISHYHFPKLSFPLLCDVSVPRLWSPQALRFNFEVS